MSYCSYKFKKRNTTKTEKLKKLIIRTRRRLSPFSNNAREVDLRELPNGVLIEK